MIREARDWDARDWDAYEHAQDINSEQYDNPEQYLDIYDRAIVSKVYAHNPDTAYHANRVANIALSIFDEISSDRNLAHMLYGIERQEFYCGGELHDAGKTGVSNDILEKPARLTDEERGDMEMHSNLGAELLQKYGRSRVVQNMAKYHHEKWNGNGYPAGLSETETPIEARILAVADVFDALASSRSYKEAMPYERATAIIQEMAGEDFDPLIVEVFCRIQEQIIEKHQTMHSEHMQLLGRGEQVKQTPKLRVLAFDMARKAVNKSPEVYASDVEVQTPAIHDNVLKFARENHINLSEVKWDGSKSQSLSQNLGHYSNIA